MNTIARCTLSGSGDNTLFECIKTCVPAKIVPPWIDAQKDQLVRRAMTDPTVTFEVGAPDKKYWIEYGKTHPLGAGN